MPKNMTLDAKQIILSLLNLKGIGPAFIGKHLLKVKSALEKKQDIITLLEACKKNIYEIEIIKQAVEKAEKTINIAKTQDIGIVTMFDDTYPKRLLTQNPKFPILFFKGAPKFNLPTIGIIGSREATEIGKKIAERIGSYFAENSFQIVHGIAIGIDMASSNNPKAGNNTIGVIPGGLNFTEEKTLNKTYKATAEKVLKNGGSLVSTYFPNQKQDRYSVVEYCKLQAALSDTLMIVQSQTGGGSRFTVAPFSITSRPLGVINISKFDKNSSDYYTANDLLIKDGLSGLATYTEVKETKLNCNLVIVEGKSDYEKIISLVKRKATHTTLF